MGRWVSLGWVVFGVVGCAGDGEAADPLTLTHQFPGFELDVAEEWDDQCQSWTLGNEEVLYVNAVRAINEGAVHHSNWYFVPDTEHDGPDGTFRCADRGFDQAVAAATGGVFFAQSTQAYEEEQRFAEGVVIPVPPHSRIIGNVHALNLDGRRKSTSIRFEVETVPESQVRVRLAPFSLMYRALDIAPRQRTEHSVVCDLDGEHRRRFGRPVDFKIYYVLPHYHELGDLLRFETVEADGSDRLIYETSSAVGDPLGGMIDPPLDLTGAEAVRLTCGYDNPRDVSVGAGIGDQEMCIFLAFTDSPRIWGGGMLGGTDLNQAVADDGETREIEGSCVVVTVPANASL